MDKRQERAVEFVIASKYPAKPLEFLKETFNQMALLVGIAIYCPRIADIALGWNCIGSILRIDVFSNCLSTIGFISEDIAPLDVNLAEQRNGVLGIVVITRTEQKSKRIAQAIH